MYFCLRGRINECEESCWDIVSKIAVVEDGYGSPCLYISWTNNKFEREFHDRDIDISS